MVCLRNLVLVCIAVCIPLIASKPVPDPSYGVGFGGSGLAAAALAAPLLFSILPFLFKGRGESHKKIVKEHYIHHKPTVYNIHYKEEKKKW